MRTFFGRKSTNGQPPLWLWIYAPISIVQTGVAMALHGVSTIGLLLFPFSVLLLWLLLRGWRVVWCLSVGGGVLGVIGVAWGESVWWAAAGAAGLALLLAPASRRYVWKEATLRRSLAMASEERHSWGARVASGVLWEEMWTGIGKRAVNWGFIGRLAVVFIAAEVVRGALHGARHDGLLIAVPWRVAGVVGALSLLLMLGLPVAIGIRALARRIQWGTEELP